MIDIVNITHHYGALPVLRDVTLHVDAGGLTCLMGPNGMGKSTLLAIAGGIMSPIKGYVEIAGLRRRRSVEEERQVRRKVCYLPDTPWLPDAVTGRELLLASGRLWGVEEDRLYDHAERLLDVFDLAAHATSPIGQYSTGQKKKIGVCSALVTDAPVLILDEPFSGGLDSSALHALQAIFRNLAQRKDVTVLLAVPVPELIEGLADRVAIIRQGAVIAYDSVDNLKRAAGVATLAEALERTIHPEGEEKLKSYFEARR